MIGVLLPAAMGASLVAMVGGAVLLRALRRQERMAARLLAVRLGTTAPSGTETRGDALRFVATLGAAVARSGLLSARTIAQLETTLHSAGLRGGNGLGVFVGGKLLLLVLLPALAWVALGYVGAGGLMFNAGLAVAAVVGMLLPDFIVRGRRKAYLKRLDAGLPDALDMMVICSEAGLGLEPAIARVAAEIGTAHPAVAEEMAQTATELRLIADRRQALLNMGERTGLASLKRLGATLIQTLQYGTPLSQALRTLSAEMRGEMLVRFEAKAAKLPVMLTVPMIVFILPTVFIIVGGPAMLSVLASLRH